MLNGITPPICSSNYFLTWISVCLSSMVSCRGFLIFNWKPHSAFLALYAVHLCIWCELIIAQESPFPPLYLRFKMLFLISDTNYDVILIFISTSCSFFSMLLDQHVVIHRNPSRLQREVDVATKDKLNFMQRCIYI